MKFLGRVIINGTNLKGLKDKNKQTNKKTNKRFWDHLVQSKNFALIVFDIHFSITALVEKVFFFTLNECVIKVDNRQSIKVIKDFKCFFENM